MKLIDLTVSQFLQEVDSPSPAPGGGSVAALSIAQGISLLRMVAHLTVSKKKFQALEESIRSDYSRRMAVLDTLKKEVLELIDRDTEAFDKIMEAFKLPKGTDEEIRVRNDAIRKATLKATEVPFRTAQIALSALETASPMFAYANKSATSDFGVGSLMIYAGIGGAVMNVKTNMVGYSDRKTAGNYFRMVSELEQKAKTLTDLAVGEVSAELSFTE
jgi:formiminotetrahydrofolate cyclodeaminase